MKRWGKTKGLDLPDDNFFLESAEELKNELSGIFGDVTVIPEEHLKFGLEKMVKTARRPVLSLDRAYLDGRDGLVAGHLDVTRAVDPEFNDLGLRPRPGCKTIDEQIAELRSPDKSEVCLADDVIFGGGGIVELIKRLAEVNRPVSRVFTGIGIKEGVEKVRAEGVPVSCVIEYDEVIDEVCQRDFWGGAPLSGRTVISDKEETWSAPYFKPFGLPEKWASIPAENVEAFSAFCFLKTIELWRQVEKVNGASLRTSEVPRLLKGVEENDSIVEALMGFMITSVK
jgi:hypothetical protein